MESPADYPISTVLTTEELADLQTTGHVIRYPADTTLMSEGDDSDFVLYIKSGHIKIVKGNPPGIAGLHGPGSVIGELASITQQPRTADVVAISDIEAMYLSGDVWLDFLWHNPRAALAQLRVSGLKLSNLATKRVESILNSEQKLAKALLELEASGLGKASNDGLTFKNISQHDLAGLSGISRDSAVLVLRNLKSQHIVATGRQQITLRDLDALATIAGRKHKAVPR